MAIVTEQMQTQVAELYVGFFNRAPLAEGMTYWSNLLANGATPQSLLADAIQYTPEYASLYGGTPRQDVRTFYINVFGREPLEAGLNYWSSLVTDSNPFYNVAWSMIEAVRNGGAGINPNDTALVNNKIAVAKFYAIDLHGTDRATADTAFYGVTQDPATVTAKEAEMAQSSGGTFTLTTGADVVDAAGNVLVTGVVNGTPTLQAIDTITGNGANDTIRATYQAGASVADATNGALISGVENFQIRNTETAASARTVTLDASLDAGLTNASSYLSTGAVVIGNLAAGASVSVVGNGTLLNGNVDFGYATLTSAATLNLEGGVTQGTFSNTAGASTSNATSAVINSRYAANTATSIDLTETANSVTSLTVHAAANLTTGLVATDYASTATITVDGAAEAVNLGSNANVKTIDASGLTAGGLTIALGTNTTSFKGGQGNDVVTAAAVGTTTAGAVDAQGGTADVLVVGNTDLVDTAAEAAVYKNFEILKNTDATATYDLSLFTQSTINALQQNNAGGDVTFSNTTAAQAAAVTLQASAANVGLSLATSTGTSDVASLTLGTGLTTSAATSITTGLTVNGFETLNLTTAAGPSSTTGTNRTSTVAAITGANLTTINLAGTAVTLTNAATALATTINATSLVGDGAATPVGLTIGGNLAVGSTVNGSAVKDVMNLGTVGSTYNGGAGNDTFAATAVTQLQNGAVYNTIVGGAGTADLLQITANAVTLIDANFRQVSGVETLTVDSDGGAGDISVTTGGYFDNNFANATVNLLAANDDAVTYVGTSYTSDLTLAVTTAGDGASTADNVSLSTGEGDDTVTVAAADWVGGTTAGGAIAVTTAAGDDTISVTTGTLTTTSQGSVTITGGLGQDDITATHVNVGSSAGNLGFFTYVVAAGDSLIGSYDTITGFKMSDIGGSGGLVSDKLDIADTTLAAAVTAGAVTGYTAAQLTYSVNNTTGAFTLAGTSASSLSVATVLDIMNAYIANGQVAFYKTSTDTYIYNANATADTVVELVGVQAAALITTNSITTDNGVFIA